MAAGYARYGKSFRAALDEVVRVPREPGCFCPAPDDSRRHRWERVLDSHGLGHIHTIDRCVDCGMLYEFTANLLRGHSHDRRRYYREVKP